MKAVIGVFKAVLNGYTMRTVSSYIQGRNMQCQMSFAERFEEKMTRVYFWL